MESSKKVEYFIEESSRYNSRVSRIGYPLNKDLGKREVRSLRRSHPSEVYSLYSYSPEEGVKEIFVEDF